MKSQNNWCNTHEGFKVDHFQKRRRWVFSPLTEKSRKISQIVQVHQKVLVMDINNRRK
jgi:hypothetical protein